MNEKRFDETMKDIYDKLTEEQKKKANECKTADDFMKLMGEYGIELPDDLVEGISAGGIWENLYGYTPPSHPIV